MVNLQDSPEMESSLNIEPSVGRAKRGNRASLGRLQQAIWIVVDQKVAQKLVHLPEYLRMMWPKLAYTQFSAENSIVLEELLTLLEHPVLSIRQKHQMKKALSSLRVLLRTISGIEEQANRVINSLK